MRRQNPPLDHGWGGRLLLLLLLLLSASSAAAEEPAALDGRIVEIDPERGAALLDLTAMQVQPGLFVEVIREEDEGLVVLARGRIVAVTPGSSTLSLTWLDPELDPPELGDRVTVYLAPPSWAGPADQEAPTSRARIDSAPREVGWGVAAEPLSEEAPDAPAAEAGSGDLVSLSFGGLGRFVTALKSAPDEAPSGEAGMWGPGGAGGLLLQGRFWRYLGLETGALLHYSRIGKTTTVPESYPGEPAPVATDYTPTIEALDLRIPIHLQAVIPVGSVRLLFAFGPELSIGLVGRALLNVTTPGRELTGAARQQWIANIETLQSRYDGAAANQFFLGGGIGLDFDLGDLSIPVRLGAAYNLTESPRFIRYWVLDAGGVQEAEPTLDLTFSIGLVYDLDLR
ncbi:MAG: hypothetical protein RBU45_02590 [Myxococcota bacterium]|nr:hypothetical protein [Myxococcota bacterium]